MADERRSIGPVAGVFITIATVIDAGVFATLGPATDRAGTGILLSVVLAGLIALASGTSGAQLGSAFQVSGGAFIWTRKVGLPAVSFAAGLCFLGKEIVGQSVNALVLIGYSRALLPAMPLHVVAFAVIVVMTFLNYFGVAPTAKVMVILSIALCVLLVLFIVLVAPHVSASRMRPVSGPGVLGLLGGAGTFFFTFAGFQRIAVIASEVKRPKRTIPISVFVGFAITSLLFLGTVAVTLGAIGAKRMGGPESVPLLSAGALTVGKWGTRLVVAAAAVASLSTLAGGILGASRVAQIMGMKHELPEQVGQAKKGTPKTAVLWFGLGTAVVTLLFDLRPLLNIANVLTLLWYGATNFAAVRLQDEERFAPRWISWAGLIGCVVLLFVLPWRAILVAAIALGALLTYRHFRNRSV